MPHRVSYTEAKRNLAKYMDMVSESQDALIVTRQKSRPVVLISLEEFNAMKETACLRSTRANARQRLSSIREADEGLAKTQEPVRPE